jgi:hypothetical protein
MSENDLLDEKPKRKTSDDTTSWMQAGLALVLSTIVMQISAFLSSTIQSMILGNKLETYKTILPSSAENINPSSTTSDLYSSSENLVFGILLWCIACIIGLFIVYGLSHSFANRLGGIGTLRGLIVRASLWVTFSYVLLNLLGAIANTMLISNVVDYAAAQSNFSAENQAFKEFLSGESLRTLILAFVAWLIWVLGFSRIIGNYYEIGQGKGCRTMLFLHLSILGLFIALTVVLGLFLN